MKKLPLFLSFAFVLALGTNLEANTITAASCSASGFQTAINSATDGDTVQGPSGGGSTTWSASVIVSKGVTLDGNGCVITQSSGAQLQVTVSTTSFFLTGFTFYGSANEGTVKITGLSSSTAICHVYNNTFDDGNPSSQGTMLTIGGNGGCLIDHNTFLAHHSADEIIHNTGMQSPTAYAGWQNDIAPATGGFVYVETNTFTDSGATFSLAMENYYGARFVFRYNTLNNVAIDAHGSSPGTCSGNGSENSTRWWEIYDNTFNSISGHGTLSQLRGGSGVFFNNTATGSGSQSVQFTEDCSSGGAWPLQAQIGRGYNPTAGSSGTSGHTSPAYIWGNGPGLNILFPNTTYVLGGTDPIDATNCSGHPGDVCDAVMTVSQPAMLQRCESAADVAASCPVSYAYKPFTYPYPLAGASNVTPPTGLSAIVQ